MKSSYRNSFIIVNNYITYPRDVNHAQLISICYLCHVATAVSVKEVFPTVPLKSGTTHHFQSEFPSLDSFKRHLKTHYFANNWPPGDCLQRLWFDILDIVRFTNCCEWMNEWMNECDHVPHMNIHQQIWQHVEGIGDMLKVSSTCRVFRKQATCCRSAVWMEHKSVMWWSSYRLWTNPVSILGRRMRRSYRIHRYSMSDDCEAVATKTYDRPDDHKLHVFCLSRHSIHISEIVSVWTRFSLVEFMKCVGFLINTTFITVNTTIIIIKRLTLR